MTDDENRGDGYMDEKVERLMSIIESLIFVSGSPVKEKRLLRAISGTGREDFESAIRLLEGKYGGASGVLLEKVAEGYQLRTNPANQDFVKEFLDTRAPRLSRASMETLSVVAYKQPVTRAEIEDIRGVDCQGSIRTLVERRLVRVVGKKDVPGKPFLFGTTREFLELFGLEDLSSLPSISELVEILGPYEEMDPGSDDLPEPGTEDGTGVPEDG